MESRQPSHPPSDQATGHVPLFSVIVNNYNYLRYLPVAIASVQHQTFRDFELIVVDDGSDDGSIDYLESIQTGLTLVRTNRLNQARACLAGIARAKGRYVYILDADDFAAPDLLETVAGRLAEAPAKVQFRLVPVGEDGAPFAPAYPDIGDRDDETAQREQIRRNGMPSSPPTSGNVFRRDLFSRLDDIDYEAAIDGVTLLYAPFAGTVVSLSRPLAFYRVHEHSKSAHAKPLDPERIRRDRRRFESRLAHLNTLLEKHHPDVAPLPAAASFFFHWDHLTLEQAALGTAVGPAVALNYVSRLFREHGVGRFTANKLAWLAIAMLAPRNIKDRALAIRRNPWPRRARRSPAVGADAITGKEVVGS
ncbi:glycosyltransferase family 2 protein [Rhodoplanes roseus]|nr:glycosyltransferase family 2 protein [Rhodoplanes roseus]